MKLANSLWLMFVLSMVPWGKAEDLIDLHQGFAGAKWGISSAELKKQMPNLEDVTGKAVPKDQDPHLQGVVLALPGTGPIVNTLFYFEQDKLDGVVRTFNTAVARCTTLSTLATVMRELLVKPAADEPGAPPLGPRRRLPTPTGTMQVPGAAPLPPVPMGAMPVPSQFPDRRQISQEPQYNFQPLILDEEITAVLRLSEGESGPEVKLTIENVRLATEARHRAEEEIHQEYLRQAREIAPKLLRP